VRVLGVSNVRVAYGHEPPDDVRCSRLAAAMLDALQGHGEYGDDIRVMISALDDTARTGVVVTENIPDGSGARIAWLLVMLRAELKGTGMTAEIVDDRTHG
jgi:hypothetical protein